MLTAGVQMNTTALSQIQRQSIHECIIECHQQNSTPSVHKDECFEIGLSILESVAGYECCDDWLLLADNSPSKYWMLSVKI